MQIKIVNDNKNNSIPEIVLKIYNLHVINISLFFDDTVMHLVLRSFYASRNYNLHLFSVEI